MSDDNSEDRVAQAAEFSDSVPLDKVWRHGFLPDGTIVLALLGIDGVNHHFVADPAAISRIAGEIFELSRKSRHIANGNDPTHFKPSTLPFSIPQDHDGLVAPFTGPMLKCDRATVHFEWLVDLLNRYSEITELTAHEIGYEDPNVIWEIRFSQHPVAAVPLIIGDVVHNLRSALDLMICDLARLQRQSVVDVKFPFAKDSPTLEKILAKDHARLGPDIVDAIRALKPFKGDGGNKLLRGLHDLDVIDKHRLIVPTFLAAWQHHDMALRVQDLLRVMAPSLETPSIMYLGENSMTTTLMHDGEKIRCKRGEDPLRYFKKHERGIVARFPMAEHSPFAGGEVIPTLNALREMVYEIVTDFRGKFNRPDQNP